jgi:hypothetical protein
LVDVSSVEKFNLLISHASFVDKIRRY